MNDDIIPTKTIKGTPDIFDIEIILNAYQEIYPETAFVDSIIEYVDKVKLFCIDNINYAIFTINIGEPDDVTINIVPVLKGAWRQMNYYMYTLPQN